LFEYVQLFLPPLGCHHRADERGEQSS
jgi:hypothetical protein